MDINSDLTNTIIGPISLNLLGKDLAIQLPQNVAQVVILIVGILPVIVFIVVIIMVLIGAIKWVKSNGNEKELEKAQKTIKNAIIGFVLLVVFFSISNLVSFLLIGFTITDAFFALAPCGANGNVLDYYNSTRTTPGYGGYTPETINQQNNTGIEAYYLYCMQNNK